MANIWQYIVFVSLVSCGGESSKSGGAGGGILDNPIGSDPKEIGKVDVENMYVKVFENESIPFVLSSQDGFDNQCEIKVKDGASDIMCRVDVPELTAVGQPIHLWINIPPESCEYTSFRVPYFWNSEPTIGPSIVQITVLDDKDTPANSADTCSFDGGAPFACADTEDMKWIDKDKAFTCRFEDCCFGEYDLYKTTQTMDAAVLTEDLLEEKDKAWPGKTERCLAGAAVTNWGWQRESIYGVYPSSYLKYTEDTGFNTVYDVLPPFVTNGRVSNISAWTANYFDPTAHSHDGFYVTRESSLPYAVDPIDDRRGTNLSVLRTNPYYELLCLDSAREVRHRIRLSIREWNELKEFELFKESKGTQGDPNSNSLTGTQGEDCGYLDLDLRCNDYHDFDYLLESIGGTYKTTPADVGDRGKYFFNIDADDIEDIASSNKKWSGTSQIVQSTDKKKEEE
jgi:hypothetical protein